MPSLRQIAPFVIAGVVLLGGSMAAHAEFIATIEQVGPNVVATGSGTIDLTGLTFTSLGDFASALLPQNGVLGIGSPSLDPEDAYTGFSGPASFGPGPGEAPSDSGSGDKVGILDNLGLLAVPAGYVSGDPLSDSSVYDDETLASLGLTPGEYTYTWNPGPTDDSIVIDIGTATTAVPEPGSLSLVTVPMSLMLLFALWRRRRS
jgi:hypothetical protein